MMSLRRRTHPAHAEPKPLPVLTLREKGESERVQSPVEGIPTEEPANARPGPAPEFERLNPGRLTQFREPAEEETNADVHGLGPFESEVAPGAKQDWIRDRAEHSSRAESKAMAKRYISENFAPSDWLAVVVLNRQSQEIIQRIATAEKIASPGFQSWLRHKNAQGADIYLSLNTLRQRSRSRTKSDIQEIRHLYLDLDFDGPQKLAAIYADPSLPHPNYVLNTSPDKFQVVWKVVGIAQNEAEALLRSLAERFGADPAATDCTRVFRIPGFNNKKYPENFLVTSEFRAPPDLVHQRADFRLDVPGRVHFSPTPRSISHAPASNRTRNSQSERDWAFALRRLAQGDSPETVMRAIAAYRGQDHPNLNATPEWKAPRKTNPRYYAERTVRRAMEHLAKAKREAPGADFETDHASRESSPSR
jgi:RepB DNA-primase from phage plasmid